jgi:uncharacterized protein YqeY
MRTVIADALKASLKAQDKRRTSTLRLINAAIQDRDITNRGNGKDPVNNEEILQILAKMVKQREESAAAFEQGNRLELAEQERQEIVIIREFMPKQLGEDETESAVRAVIAEVGAEGLRDMGRCMNALKEKFPGKMDFGKASGIVKSMLKSRRLPYPLWGGWPRSGRVGSPRPRSNFALRRHTSEATPTPSRSTPLRSVGSPTLPPSGRVKPALHPKNVTLPVSTSCMAPTMRSWPSLTRPAITSLRSVRWATV